jgi:hypothetical protein
MERAKVVNQLRKVKLVLEKHSPTARSFRFVVQVELIKRAVERNQAIKTHTLAEHGSRMRRGKGKKRRGEETATRSEEIPSEALNPSSGRDRMVVKREVPWPSLVGY